MDYSITCRARGQAFLGAHRPWDAAPATDHPRERRGRQRHGSSAAMAITLPWSEQCATFGPGSNG